MPEKSPSKRKALGKGLGALLPSRPPDDRQIPASSPPTEGIATIPIDSIDPNPYQPRRVFEQKSLDELAQSIRSDGLVQPILVQPDGSRYKLIVGERRWRAARLAGLAEITAIIREVDPDKILETTLVENIQREDLNPIEVAQALHRMIRELDLSHEEVAARTGKDRSTITNLLRLLRLPSDIQRLIAEKRISMGHARAILGLEDTDQQRVLAEKTAAQGLSVRQVERTVRRLNEPAQEKAETAVDPNIASALNDLEERLGAPVRLVQRSREKGRIEIEYGSAEDLQRIYSILMGE